MEKEKEIRISLWARFVNKVNFKRAEKVNMWFKITSCFIVLILALTLLALVSDTWSFWSKNNMMYVPLKNGNKEPNPHFKWILSSLILFTISVLASGFIVYRMISKRDLNLYKFMIIPFIILLVGFFLTFKPLNEFGVLTRTNPLPHAPEGWISRYTELSWHMLITLATVGITYLTIITTIISLERFIKNNHNR